MKLKRVAPANVVLSFEERKRLADFVMLLATIDRRLKTKAVCTCAPKAQEKKDRKAKGIYKPLDKGPPNKRGFFSVSQHTLISCKETPFYAILDPKITNNVTFGSKNAIMGKTNILDIIRSKSTVLSFKEILIASGESDPDLLKRRLHYYVKKGELYAVRRGLYAKDKNYDRLELATKIFTPAYVSFETILAQAGVIFQHYNTIFVASYKTKEIECDNQRYSFKKIQDVILTNATGIENKGNYFAASKERAFLDIVYLNKEYHFDNLSALDITKIHALLPLYKNKRMIRDVHRYFKSSAH